MHLGFRVAARAVALVAVATGCVHCLLTTSLDGLTGGDSGSTGGTTSGTSAGTTSGTTAATTGGDPDASACSADLQSDSKNCGRCGRDCAGGGCTDGLCSAFSIADGQGETRAIQVRDGFVYWASYARGVISRLPAGLAANGVAPEIVVSQPGRNLVHFAAAPEGLAWLAGKNNVDAGASGVFVADLDGGAATQVVAAGSTLNFLGRVATLGSTIFYTNNEAFTVNRVERNATGDTPLATGQAQPFGLALSSGFVVWSAGAGDAGTVSRMLPDGGEPTLLADNQGVPRDVSAFGARVYWANTKVGGDLRRATFGADGGAVVETFAPSGDNTRPWAAIEDGDRVFWTDYNLGRILTCPIAGCTAAGPETFTKGVTQATYLASDGKFLYVATSGGSILRVTR
jgi:hypothetical protein